MMLEANQGFSVTEAAIETTSMVTDDVQAYPEGQHLGQLWRNEPGRGYF